MEWGDMDDKFSKMDENFANMKANLNETFVELKTELINSIDSKLNSFITKPLVRLDILVSISYRLNHSYEYRIGYSRQVKGLNIELCLMNTN